MNTLIEAKGIAWAMYKGAYTAAEAISYAAICCDLDEFQLEDLTVIINNKIAKGH
jgi:hypothetical protein